MNDSYDCLAGVQQPPRCHILGPQLLLNAAVSWVQGLMGLASPSILPALEPYTSNLYIP